MNRMKKLVVMLAAVLVLAMGLQSVALAATSSPSKVDISTGSGSVATVTYTAKAQHPAVKIVVNGKTLVEGTDFEVVSKDFIGAGKHYVVIKGINAFDGEMKLIWKIDPKASTLTTTQSHATISAKNVAKKSTIVKVTPKTGVKATVKYTVVKAPKGGASRILVNSKGEVKIGKGAPAGTYKVKVTSTPSSPNFTGTSRVISIVVK